MITDKEIAQWDEWFTLDEQANKEWNAAKSVGADLQTWATLIEFNRIDRVMEAKEMNDASI